MRFRVLGPVRVEHGGEAVSLGGPQQRLVLALLIAARGRVVSSPALMEAIWGHDVPPTAKKTIQGYVSKLRGELGDLLVTEGNGYALSVPDESVDAVQFEQLGIRAAESMHDDPVTAVALCRDALGLWDGTAYADLADHLALTPEIARLEGLRMSVLGDRIDAELACGAHNSLIGELDGLTQEYPLQERFRGQHMLALYRAGRQVEALRVFERTRRYLADEMGLEPSAALRELEAQILTEDESLAVP